jgi:serine/threonine protein phosphatase 1
MAKAFVIGDIHGAHKALQQCLSRAGFDYAQDRLICLGDVCDGWPGVRESIDELLNIKHLTYLLGNHDQWTLEWMDNGEAEEIWLEQGGRATVASYRDGIPKAHQALLKNAKLFLEENSRLFVHAGILPGEDAKFSSPGILLWDRTLVRNAMDLHHKGLSENLTRYDEVFVGHTPIHSPVPMKFCEIWMMDTGAGWSGVLSMMNLDTYEVFTSDPVPGLYPGMRGR